LEFARISQVLPYVHAVPAVLNNELE
jgi:hypothetical protein